MRDSLCRGRDGTPESPIKLWRALEGSWNSELSVVSMDIFEHAYTSIPQEHFPWLSLV